MMDFEREVKAAEGRIRPFIRHTYLDYSPFYSRLGDASVYLKLENLQHTGSFKVRGALNKVLALTEGGEVRKVVTASTGNHGAAVAFACQQMELDALVFVPEDAAEPKVNSIQQMGAQIRRVAGDPLAAEQAARRFSESSGQPYVPPYNDPLVIGGQGTIGLELAWQLPSAEVVFIALGGGGLVSGVAGYLKARKPNIHIVACSPANSQVMIQSVHAGRIIEMESKPTLSDGTAGGVEAGSITFPFVQKLVDEFVTVSEAQIAAELRAFIGSHHMLIEGAAAVALAGFRQMRAKFEGNDVVVILCGANISTAALKGIL